MAKVKVFVTDGQTDGRTDRGTDGRMRFNVPTLSRKRGTKKEWGRGTKFESCIGNTCICMCALVKFTTHFTSNEVHPYTDLKAKQFEFINTCATNIISSLRHLFGVYTMRRRHVWYCAVCVCTVTSSTSTCAVLIRKHVMFKNSYFLFLLT